MFNFFKKKEKKLFFTTDMHSHLIPGVDDGASDLNTSINICRELEKLGITRSILTPHVTAITFPNTPLTIEEPFERLRNELEKQQLNFEIIHSAEYRLDEFFEKEALATNDLMLFPNDYILIENSFMQQALNFEQIVYTIKSRGLHPILAHPERYYYYAEHRNHYKDLHNFEVLFQCNLLSFSGYYGKGEKEAAFWLLENGMVDFIGTDTHRMKHTELIREFIGTRDYKKLAAKAEIRNEFAFDIDD